MFRHSQEKSHWLDKTCNLFTSFHSNFSFLFSLPSEQIFLNWVFDFFPICERIREADQKSSSQMICPDGSHIDEVDPDQCPFL